MLRSMIAVNTLLAAAAVIRAPSLDDVASEMLAFAAYGEPMLIVSLALVCLARRWLVTLGSAGAYLVVAVFELALAYSFHLLAANVSLAQQMPFTQLAAITVFVVGISLAYLDFRARALSPAVAEARIQALQARIRPHFLYNSINAVLALMRSDPRRAEHALEDMADLFRLLMADNRTLAPIASEVELAAQYLAIESIRLGERLRVSWRTEGMPADALVPPLMLQPLVENAVYHGVEPLPAGGEIAIDIARAGTQIHMTLSKPYPAEDRHAPRNRMAIAHIRERPQLHLDAEASMEREVRHGN